MAKDATLSWEEAVTWLRQQPEHQALVQACYFDDPLLDACERFMQSGEWQATARFLPKTKGKALDIGAGRGISSYALVKEGWQVTALEPDPSALVGAEAIRQLAQSNGLAIDVVVEWGESLPFPDNHFDLVMARQVLHHARNLESLCSEVSRVLKPNGLLIATREHVISKPEDLQRFLKKHPLHQLYGGEHAYLLREYTDAITKAGLNLQAVLGSWESEINYFPMTEQQWRDKVLSPVSRYLPSSLLDSLISREHPLGRLILENLAKWKSQRDKAAGRLYSFIAKK